MLVVGLCRDLALLIPNYSSHAYTTAWEGSLPILLLAQSVAAIALYRAIADLYPRIGQFALWLFNAALALTALVCVALVPNELAHISRGEAALRTMILLQRWIASELAGGMILAGLFLARFPRPARKLPTNLITHAALLTGYFSVTAALMLFENLAPLGTQSVLEQLELATVIALYATWAFRLSRAGRASESWPALATDAAHALYERERRTRELYAGAAK